MQKLNRYYDMIKTTQPAPKLARVSNGVKLSKAQKTTTKKDK